MQSYFRTTTLGSSDDALKLYVAARIANLWKCDSMNLTMEQCLQGAMDVLQTGYIDRYPGGVGIGHYALALWFYEITNMNFPFDTLRAIAYYYLRESSGSFPQLALFKGTGDALQPLLGSTGLWPDDLLVVMNPREETITIFTFELFD